MRRLRSRKASACSSCTAARTADGGRRGRHGRAEAHGDRVGNAARHLPEKTAALEAEDAAPYAVEIHGNDGDFDAFHDALEAATEGKHLAGARDLAFGEDADDLVLAQRVAGGAERADHFAGTLLAGDGNGLHHAGEGLDDAVVVDALVHQEADGPVGRGDEQRHIDERHVIADEQCAGLLREVVAAENLDAVDGVRDEEEDEAAEPLRQQDENVDCAGGGDDRGGQHDAARIEMDEFGEDEVGAGGERDADEGEQIGGGDDAALVFLGGAVLDERVDGNGEESGPEAERRRAEWRNR